jgi:hypothetical protein
LQDSGERLELQRLYTSDTNSYYVTIDAVRYNDRAPWPPAADGGGFSLQRRVLTAFGDDPANWTAAPPTPGTDLPAGLPPVIVTQPLSLMVTSSQPASFTVEVTGTEPLYYQWRFNGQALPGATARDLLLPTTGPSAAGNYSVLVYNEAGSAVSSNATLTLAFPPVIVQQPRSVAVRGSTNAATYGQTGSNVTFTVLATGLAPLTYQWRFGGQDIAGATNGSLTLTNVTLAQEGAYDVLVTDRVGSTASSTALLSILLTPAFAQVPTNQLVWAGTNLVWTVAVTGNPLPFGFEWKHLSGGRTLASNTVSRREDSLVLENVQPSQAGLYSITVRNPAVPGGITASFSLTVYADSDNDGLPDHWELRYFGNALVANPGADSDNDTLNNLEEYIAGTNPVDPLSYLKVNRVRPGLGVTSIEFSAVSNLTYTVQFSDKLQPVVWQRLSDVPARPFNRTETITDPAPAERRFYRLVTPRLE